MTDSRTQREPWDAFCLLAREFAKMLQTIIPLEEQPACAAWALDFFTQQTQTQYSHEPNGAAEHECAKAPGVSESRLKFAKMWYGHAKPYIAACEVDSPDPALLRVYDHNQMIRQFQLFKVYSMLSGEHQDMVWQWLRKLNRRAAEAVEKAGEGTECRMPGSVPASAPAPYVDDVTVAVNA